MDWGWTSTAGSRVSTIRVAAVVENARRALGRLSLLVCCALLGQILGKVDAARLPVVTS